MKTAIKLLGALAMLALAGCVTKEATQQERRELDARAGIPPAPTTTVRDEGEAAARKQAQIAATDWSAEMKVMVAKQQIAVGMTPEQVEMSRGRPRRKYFEGGVGPQVETWEYYTSTLYFLDGKLVRWIQSQG